MATGLPLRLGNRLCRPPVSDRILPGSYRAAWGIYGPTAGNCGKQQQVEYGQPVLPMEQEPGGLIFSSVIPGHSFFIWNLQQPTRLLEMTPPVQPAG